MRVLKHICFITINLLLPYLLVNLLMLVDFLENGSGIQSERDYEKNKWIWISVFVLFGITHLFLFLKYFKCDKIGKWILSAFISLIYCYIGVKYFWW